MRLIKTTRHRECVRIFNSVTSEIFGEITTFGNPPASVAKSAHSRGKLLSPAIATLSPLLIANASRPKTVFAPSRRNRAKRCLRSGQAAVPSKGALIKLADALEKKLP